MDALTYLLLIAGRSGVGKSSVGNEIHHQLSEREVMHGFIEGDNLDMAFPIPWEHRLAERNLAEMWNNYRGLGHTRLVYTNTASVLHADLLKQALGGEVNVTGVLLTATDTSARERLAGREVGSALELHLRRSRQRAVELETESAVWVTRVPTDGRRVADIAGAIITLTGW